MSQYPLTPEAKILKAQRTAQALANRKARRREYEKTPARKAYRKERRKQWRIKNPEKNRERERLKWQRYKARNPHKAYLIGKRHHQRYRARYPEKFRKNYLKSRHSLSIEDYNNTLIKQNNLCAICHKPYEKVLHVDHCHKTGLRRGLLCSHCNRGIGCFFDDTEIMKKAIDYLINPPGIVRDMNQLELFPIDNVKESSEIQKKSERSLDITLSI